MSSSITNQPSEAFIRALTQHQTALNGYCHASLGQSDEAKEAAQRTNITLWRKCDQWNPATDFIPWAISVAKYEVLGVIRDRNRLQSRFVFDPDVAEMMADEASLYVSGCSERAEHLQLCLGKLNSSNRQTITNFYLHEQSIQEISTATNKSPSAVKVMLMRLRVVLRDCVESRISKGGVA